MSGSLTDSYGGCGPVGHGENIFWLGENSNAVGVIWLGFDKFDKLGTASDIM